MISTKEKLQNLDLPDILQSREKQKELASQGLLVEAFIALEKPVLQEIIQLLSSQELRDLINRGEITLAMIKPALTESTTLAVTLTEDKQNQLLIEAISPPLDPIFEIVLPMDEETLEAWYGGKPKQAQSQISPIDTTRYGQTHYSRWDEFVALMNRGSVTFVLLFDSNGNAVAEWREQMGNHWNVEKVKHEYPNSLRALYAVDNHNNIFHGSDSPQSVIKEIELLVGLIEKKIALSEA